MFVLRTPVYERPFGVPAHAATAERPAESIDRLLKRPAEATWDDACEA
jgi:hypothetical protein